MKKRLLALLMVTAMTVSMFTACGSKDEPQNDNTQTENQGTEDNDKSETQYVSAEEAAKAEGVHVLDVRAWENYTAGRVQNSEWCPIFPLEDESLVDNMKAYAAANLQDDKAIFIICNSGARGAVKATETLLAAGIDASRLYTVEGGAKALAEVKDALTTKRQEDSIQWQYVSAADAVAAVGNADIQIVDVRDAETFGQGSLEGAVRAGAKDVADPAVQTEVYELAKTLDPEKDVYFLCYSGNNCAKSAISVFKDAGFSLDKLFIIEGGAKDETVSAAFVK